MYLPVNGARTVTTINIFTTAFTSTKVSTITTVTNIKPYTAALCVSTAVTIRDL